MLVRVHVNWCFKEASGIGLLACMLLARVAVPALASLAGVPMSCALTLMHARHFPLIPFAFRSYVTPSCVLIYSSA